MTFPTKPAAAYGYTDYQASNPTSPLPGTQVSADFARHKASIDAVVDFQQLIQRSDGRLANGSVRPETLTAGTLALIGKLTPRGEWVTATSYAVNDFITKDGGTYICIVAHTSGTFSTDAAAGKWQILDSADSARLGSTNLFTGTNTYQGVTNFDGAVDFDGAADFSAAETHSGAVTFSGTVAVPTASPGDSDTTAASTAFVAAALLATVPTGVVWPYAGASAPAGFLLCQGQAVSRTDNAALFAAIGTTYGSGNGSTTFNVPDLGGRVVAGKESNATRLTSGAGGVDGATLGAAGGTQTHTLIAGEMPSHTHSYTQTASNNTENVVNTGQVAWGNGDNSAALIQTTASAGSGGAHKNTQPTIILNYVIKT